MFQTLHKVHDLGHLQLNILRQPIHILILIGGFLVELDRSKGLLLLDHQLAHELAELVLDPLVLGLEKLDLFLQLLALLLHALGVGLLGFQALLKLLCLFDLRVDDALGLLVLHHQLFDLFLVGLHLLLQDLVLLADLLGQ